MSKKYSTTNTLVIVESPAKCKKIEEYLGPGYKCIATYGHLRELSSLKNIDITNNFTPSYTIIQNAIKKKQIENIRKEIKNANEVILATDDDREGEKISFCITEIFKLDINKTKRITFNEITETAIQNAIKNPRLINMDLVNAQQARQILDLLVGFKISPILWKYISRNSDHALSAGRCQTPALKLVYDNEKEIKSIEERKVYNTIGYFTNCNLPFDLNKQFESEDEIYDFLNNSINYSHIYNCSQPMKVIKSQPEPFITSRLQQVASNELNLTPKDTMQICQKLYESGFITYMRTDSKIYSQEFINSTKEYILKTYPDGIKYINKKYLDEINTTEEINTTNKPKKQNKKKQNDLKTQDAHEAIRPTNISLNDIPETFNNKERKMYKLIWENTLESCMTPAMYYAITSTISAFNNSKFTYTSELIDFPGWKIVKKKYSLENKDYKYLQMLKQNEVIPYKKITSKMILKNLKQHYTEAKLVQLLEEKGIGRPSTFASLVDKIQEKGYVKKENIKGKNLLCKDFELEEKNITKIETMREFGNENNKLVIQPLGIIVMDFLYKHFELLFNYDYTFEMEESLDKIAKNNLLWVNLCETCNNQIDLLVDKLNETDEKKKEIQLDENNTYIIGKYGPVIKCIEKIDDEKDKIIFKKVKKELDIHKLERNEYKLEEIIYDEKDIKKHFIIGEYEGKEVVIKKGKYGIYIKYGNNTKSLKELGNRPIENITFDEIKKYLTEESNILRVINSNFSIRKGPKGDYLFYKSQKMKKPKFFDIKNFTNELKEDYKICDIHILKSWINEKYQITI